MDAAKPAWTGKPCVALMGYRGPYVPRRPVLFGIVLPFPSPDPDDDGPVTEVRTRRTGRPRKVESQAIAAGLTETRLNIARLRDR